MNVKLHIRLAVARRFFLSHEEDVVCSNDWDHERYGLVSIDFLIFNFMTLSTNFWTVSFLFLSMYYYWILSHRKMICSECTLP